jgi:MerR family regulatory protein
MPAAERTLASSDPPTLLSIGELSERTGVPTSALRYYDELDWCGRRLGRRDDGGMPRRQSETSA